MMVDSKIEIEVGTSFGPVTIAIIGVSGKDPKCETNEVEENDEALIQIKEGNTYQYEIKTAGYFLKRSDYISPFIGKEHLGLIRPNTYVGTLTIDLYCNKTQEACGKLLLEVQSVKVCYRTEYRFMLEEITEKCSALLLQHNSPVSHFFESNAEADAETLYQRFAFINSMLDSTEFNEAVQKVISSPVTRWTESETFKDVRSVKRLNSSALRQIGSATDRMPLPGDHPLKRKIDSVPSRLNVNCKTETVDTHENRFIKHVLIYFQSFCSEFKAKLNANSRLKQEASRLDKKLESYLSHSFFKEISTPRSLSLNSPVLQRKEGYREVLRVWLMFDLAAKLVWHGGSDVYSGNKRDVAVLYEYWLFFKLFDIVKEAFSIRPLSVRDLIEETEDGLGLKLKQGKPLSVEGEYNGSTRKLKVEFSYNKTFSGYQKYPNGGSWSRSLRPDYTLSIWPDQISQSEAEREELIVHIHFDAKYKVEDITSLFGKGDKETENDELTEEKQELYKGTFKRVDLLKMHTYRDAIRRTSGAYILYPGSESKTFEGFHELLPGVGAFPIRPSKENDGTDQLIKFLKEVIDHFMNRASQREKISLKAYETYLIKSEPIHEVKAVLPETIRANRDLIPDETYVLVGYYKNRDQLKWIQNNKLYNTRIGSTKGSLHLGPKETSARYLVLHNKYETTAQLMLKLDGKGPQIYSKDDLKTKGYVSPNHDFYLVYTIGEDLDAEFENLTFDLERLRALSPSTDKAIPFTITLAELMKTTKRERMGAPR